MHELPEPSSVFYAEATAVLCSLNSPSQDHRTKEQIPWYPVTQGLGEGVSKQEAFVKTAPVVFRRLVASVTTAWLASRWPKGWTLSERSESPR